MLYKEFGLVGEEIKINAEAFLEQEDTAKSHFLLNKADLFFIEDLRKFLEKEELVKNLSRYHQKWLKQNNFLFGFAATYQESPHPTKLLLLMPQDKAGALFSGKEKQKLDKILVHFKHHFFTYHVGEDERETLFLDDLCIDSNKKQAALSFTGTPLKIRICNWEETRQNLQKILEKITPKGKH